MTQRHIRRTRTSVGVEVTARSIPITRRRSDVSRQVDPDYQKGLYGGVSPISPPYSPEDLFRMVETSNMLLQCILAYVTNIALYGWEIVSADDKSEKDPAEEAELQSFIDSPNADESLMTLHARVVFDRYAAGFGYVEVIRDRKGRPSILRRAPARTTMVCPKDPTNVRVSYDVMRGPRVSYVSEYKNFRIYRQHAGGVFRYFKEMGDPRRLNMETGVFETPDNPVPDDKLATELIHFRSLLSDDPYGIPEWINQLPSIMGSREAEEVNLRYFEDNTVPPMLLTVAGGRLTRASYNDLVNKLNAQAVGKERQNQIMLLEAVPEQAGLEDKGTVQIKVDKLTDARQGDGLFAKYDEANQSKVRSSMRLPPVLVGLSQDVTFATANVSAFIAETQVFLPARTAFDEVYNKRFVNSPHGLGLKTVALRSKAPTVTNPEMLLKALTALNNMGAVTPRTALESARKILQLDLPSYPQKGEDGYEEWMDKPIIFVTKGGDNTTTTTDPAKAGNTHDGQALKDQNTLSAEAGNVGMTQPKNGSQ